MSLLTQKLFWLLLLLLTLIGCSLSLKCYRCETKLACEKDPNDTCKDNPPVCPDRHEITCENNTSSETDNSTQFCSRVEADGHVVSLDCTTSNDEPTCVDDDDERMTEAKKTMLDEWGMEVKDKLKACDCNKDLCNGQALKTWTISEKSGGTRHCSDFFLSLAMISTICFLYLRQT